ncbi:MAG TPA: methyltransferase domain-containing protein [Ktedonobacteraceae bacterium]
MTRNTQDHWAQWLLHRRFGGDPQHGQAMLEELSAWRDRILAHATITPGETVLDVGCGDGLIAFGALDRVGEEGLVIFSDISQDLLDHCRSLAQQLQVLDRCRFVRAPADDLAAIAPGSVDVVTTRSVLIYVQAKQQALHEFYRVLKPGGRLSIFEPINRFCFPEPPKMFLGYDVTPIEEIAGKVRAVFERIHSPESSPLLNFDERDLLTFAERAGFAEIHLELQATIKQPKLLDSYDETSRSKWETLLKSSGNPLNPTLEEAMAQALSPQEAEQFTAYLRPLVETMQGYERQAVVYLWAVKR